MNNKKLLSNQKESQTSLLRKEEGGLSRHFSIVNYCNFCGGSMTDPRSFIVEYWRSDQTVYFCWCHACGNRWELVQVTHITTTELEGGDEDY